MEMIIAETMKEVADFLSKTRALGRSAGLVPTMGALHKGHLSLIDCSTSENDVTVVTIFVNPTQFNDQKDLENYPRNLGKDLELLEGTGCSLVFVPGVKTIYPRPDRRVFDFGGLDKTMEGLYRPGHFNGVAQVVSRLFEIISPDRAYFGEKDIQQLAIIRKMTHMLGMPVEIRACPTLREADGLAMSSRNVLLDAEQRKSAALIYRTLQQAADKTDMDVEQLKEWVARKINGNPALELEYFEIVDSINLQPAGSRTGSEKVIGCIAVRAGRIRLIDNIFFPNFAHYDD
jgi:pantoate--beta-alanine ligase